MSGPIQPYMARYVKTRFFLIPEEDFIYQGILLQDTLECLQDTEHWKKIDKQYQEVVNEFMKSIVEMNSGKPFKYTLVTLVTSLSAFISTIVADTIAEKYKRGILSTVDVEEAVKASVKATIEHIALLLEIFYDDIVKTTLNALAKSKVPVPVDNNTMVR